jgi:hypothetical protein
MHIVKFVFSSLVYLFFSNMGVVDYFWSSSRETLSMPEAHIIFAFISIFIWEIFEDTIDALTARSPKE